MNYQSEIKKYKIECNQSSYSIYYKPDLESSWFFIGKTNFYMIAKHLVNEHIKYRNKKEKSTYYFTKNGV